MKTTVHIPDSLLDAARRVARDEDTTLKALIEEGLRRAVAEHEQSSAFKLREASFKGEGLQPSVAGAAWEQIRGLTYEGRGG